MATRDIKARLSLDGEQQYKQSIKQAQSALQRLRSELKAETAEMGKNASAQEKNAAKAKSLRAQIAEQEKIVKTLSDALKEAQEKFADNQEEQNRWAVQLNNARTTLANMRNQLQQTTNSVQEMTTSVKEAAPAIREDGVQAVVSFGDAIDGLKDIASSVKDSITGIFSAMSNTISSVAQGMFDLMSQAWAAAGEYGGLRDVWGGSEQDWERMIIGAKGAGFKSEDVTGAISKLVTNTHNANKETMAVLNAWGMEEGQFASHTEYYMAVMERLAQETDPAKRLEYAQKLFGDQSGTGATQLALKWGQIMSGQESILATGGAGVGAHGAEMENAGDAWTFLMTNWDEFKTFLGTKLTITLGFEGLTNDATQILQDIMTIFGDGTNDQKYEATIRLSADIQKFVDDFTTGLQNLTNWMHDISENLMSSDDPKVQAIGRLIDKLAQLGDWIVQHMDDIINLLDKLFPIWLANAGLEMTTGKGIGGWIDTGVGIGLDVAKIAGFTKVAKALGGAGGAASSAAAGGGLLSSIGTAIGGATSTIGSLVSAAGGLAAFPLAVAAMLPGAIAGVGQDNARRNAELGGFSYDNDTREAARAWYESYLSDDYDSELYDIFEEMVGDAEAYRFRQAVEDHRLGFTAADSGYTFDDLFSAQFGTGTNDVSLMNMMVQQAMANLRGGNGEESLADKLANTSADAIRDSLHGMGVYIDGTAAGHILAPTISEELAVGYITD